MAGRAGRWRGAGAASLRRAHLFCSRLGTVCLLVPVLIAFTVRHGLSRPSCWGRRGCAFELLRTRTTTAVRSVRPRRVLRCAGGIYFFMQKRKTGLWCNGRRMYYSAAGIHILRGMKNAFLHFYHTRRRCLYAHAHRSCGGALCVLQSRRREASAGLALMPCRAPAERLTTAAITPPELSGRRRILLACAAALSHGAQEGVATSSLAAELLAAHCAAPPSPSAWTGCWMDDAAHRVCAYVYLRLHCVCAAFPFAFTTAC